MGTLDPRPSRQLTSRECCGLIGGMLGVLAANADPDDVAVALAWWSLQAAERGEAWRALVDVSLPARERLEPLPPL